MNSIFEKAKHAGVLVSIGEANWDIYYLEGKCYSSPKDDKPSCEPSYFGDLYYVENNIKRHAEYPKHNLLMVLFKE